VNLCSDFFLNIIIEKFIFVKGLYPPQSMPNFSEEKIRKYVGENGINAIVKTLEFLSHWLVFQSWNKPGDKTVQEWQLLVDKRFAQKEFLEQCQKWWQEKGRQSKML